MFQPDCSWFRTFYTSPLGKTVAHVLSERIGLLEPNIKTPAPTSIFLGMGYACPMLENLGMLANNAMANIVLMPSAQGVSRWPPGHPNRAALSDPLHLPFADASLDYVLVTHALEFSDQPLHQLREIWWVLKESGRLILIVPHRMSLWARLEHTPFGHGRPYSTLQLRQLLEDTLFSTFIISGALFFPPVQEPTLLRCLAPLESLRSRFLPSWGGGALIAVAEKRIYASVAPAEAHKVRFAEEAVKQ